MKRSAFTLLQWLAVVSLLVGILLAVFQPALTGYGDVDGFAWSAILLRFCLYAPLCFITFGLLLFPVKIARWFFSWRVIKGCLRALAVLLALVVLFYLEEDWRGKHAWESYRHEWEAKGEKFDFASFIPPPIPDDQNFALAPIVASSYSRYLDKNGNRLQPENTNVVDRLDMDPYGNRPDLSYANTNTLGGWRRSERINLAGWQQYYRAPGDTKHHATATNIFPTAISPQMPAADVLLALSKYDSAVEELRQAAKQFPQSRFPLDYEIGPPGAIWLPHLSSFLDSGELLELRALAELANKQSEKALADIGLIIRLSDSIQNEPEIYSQFDRVWLLRDTIQPIWEGLVVHRWSGEQLLDLNQRMGKIDLLTEYPFALRSARAEKIATIDFMRSHRAQAWNYVSTSDLGVPVPFLVQFISFLVPSGWFYDGELTIGRIYEPTIPTTDGKQTELVSVAAHRAIKMTEYERQHLSPYNAIALMTDPYCGLLAENFIETQSSIDLARVSCALERYRLSHNEYPESLDTLAPQFIAAVPFDVINGQPLHYRRTADGNFVLYSVGWNETDDGGIPGVTEGGYNDYRKGDWVWQYPKP